MMEINISALLKKKKIAKNKGNLKILEECTRQLGNIYYSSGKFELALSEYMEQLSICEKLKNEYNALIAHRMIGEVYTKLANFKKALHHLRKYLEEARKLENKIEEQRAETTLGNLYLAMYDAGTDKKKKENAKKMATHAYSKSISLCNEVPQDLLTTEDLASMRVRAIYNYSLVVDEKDSAIKLLETAINYCQTDTYVLKDDLSRAHVALGSVYDKKQEFELAEKHYKEAQNIEDWELKSNAMFLRAELYMKLGRLEDALNILKKIRKVNETPLDTKEHTEKALKIIIYINNLERKLETETSDAEKLALYDKLGDASCTIHNYPKAIKYYELMLECAERTSNTNRQTAALTSLYTTLREVERFSEGLAYARKELSLMEKPSEITKSLIEVVTFLIAMKSPDSEIRVSFNAALENARKSGKSSLERLVLQQMITYFDESKQLEDAEILKKQLQAVDGDSSDSEEGEGIDESWKEICLDELLEAEEGATKPRRRYPRVTYRRVKNLKGETPLQVACIAGDAKMVQSLIESGAPVNTRDNAGWTPLHEAANHGFLDIVQLLVDAGAYVNDSGGKDCGGLTPLLDAAENGHLPVVEFLVNVGANPNMLKEDGSTVLDCLRRKRKRTKDLTDEEEVEYQNTWGRMRALVTVQSRFERDNYQSDDDLEEEDKQEKNEVEDRPERVSATELYRRAIEEVKHPRNYLAKVTQKETTKKAPLIECEELLEDDWLVEDLDLANTASAPVTDPLARASTSGIVKRKSDSFLTSEKNKRNKCEISSPAKLDTFCDPDNDSDESPHPRRTLTEANLNTFCDPDDSDESVHPRRRTFTEAKSDTFRDPDDSDESSVHPRRRTFTESRRRPLTSSSLESFVGANQDGGDYVIRIQSDSSWEPFSPSTRSPARKRKKQTTLIDQGFESELDFHLISPTTTNTERTRIAKLRVWLEDRSYEVDVLVVDDMKSVEKDILEQISRKYKNEMAVDVKIKFAVPDLESSLRALRIREQTSLDLKAEIVEFSVPPLCERYRILCGSKGIEVKESALKSLSLCESSSNFKLDSDYTKKGELPIIINSLKYQTQLQTLNMSGYGLYFLGDVVNLALENHVFLQTLNLELCDIGFKCFSKIKTLPPKLRELNLSHNPLGSKSRDHLFRLLQPLTELESLNLSGCKLSNFNLDFVPNSVSYLNLSSNLMERLEMLHPRQRHFVELNLSFTKLSYMDYSPVIQIAKDQRCISMALESLELCGVGLRDRDLDIILLNTGSLRRLKIHDNKLVTHVGLSKVLNFKPTIRELSVCNCQLISQPPEKRTFIENPEICTLLVSMEKSAVQYWENLWRGVCTTKLLKLNVVKFQPGQSAW